jgi:hypothetical protein
VDVLTPAGSVPCIVKLIPDWDEDDDVANRVYGSGAASFPAAHALLQQAAVPLPQLYAALTPQPELPFFCYVMERLPGDDVLTLRARLAGPSQIDLDALAGHHLGAIHRITRSFDGWADWTTPASLDWRAAFFTALRTVLERACVHTEILPHRQPLVQMFDHFAGTWIDPSRFVLSHGDGLQGMAVQTTSGWALSGVMDIEDHRFTDQRFALAVYEVEVSLRQPPLHDSFWTEYLQQTTLEPSYSQFRPLFQLYVLLDWLGSIPPAQTDDIARLTHEIACRV